MHACMYVLYVVCSLLKVMLMKSFSSTSRKSYSVLFSERACTGMYSAECIVLCVHTINYCYYFYVSIRFTGSVKLKGILLVGGEEEQHPRQLKL